MLYNIGLFIRYCFMILFGAQGEWKTLEKYSIGRRWCNTTQNNDWTSHEPEVKVKVDGDNKKFWFSRAELLAKKHMKPNFRTFREEGSKG